MRVGWYRSVINIPHAFAIGSFIDELAHAAGRDPKEFLLELLGPTASSTWSKVGLTGKPWNYGDSFREVIRSTPAGCAASWNWLRAKAGWGQPLTPGRGRGLAVHRSFLSYIAMVIEAASARPGRSAFRGSTSPLDGGFIANPDRVQAQFEGATMMGIEQRAVRRDHLQERRGRCSRTSVTTGWCE